MTNPRRGPRNYGEAVSEPRVETFTDDSRPNWAKPGTARPLRVTVWTPDGMGPWPTVVISHGTGGATKDLAWLAEPLRVAGFLVAGVDHHGNSYQDEYLPEGFGRMWERPLDVSLLLDRLIAAGEADPARVGAAGFSLGGYTVSALLGARVNPDVLRAIVSGHIPVAPTPEFPDFLERLTGSLTAADIDVMADEGGRDVRDPRVRAGFMMAPAIAQLLVADSLGEVSAPVRVVWGDADDNAEPESNALIYAALMPNAAGHSVGPQVGHYAFHGDDAAGEAVRSEVATEAVDFFLRELAAERA